MTIVNPENAGILRDTTNEEERKGCYQITRDHNVALCTCPTWTREHCEAVAAVKRAISELEQAKDRKLGRIRAETTDLT